MNRIKMGASVISTAAVVALVLGGCSSTKSTASPSPSPSTTPTTALIVVATTIPGLTPPRGAFTQSAKGNVSAKTFTLTDSAAGPATGTIAEINETDSRETARLRGGTVTTTERYRLIARPNGTHAIVGTGTCVSGTGIFLHVRCTYRLNGTSIDATGDFTTHTTGTYS